MSKLAFVFPGQGSQKSSMLAELAQQYPQLVDTIAEAGDAISLDLWGIIQDKDTTLLNQTEITQPALLASSLAIWRLWAQLDGRPADVMAGHSLGEYSALVCAGALEFTDAIRLVHKRGQYMQQAVPAGTGSMAAIVGLDNAKIITACEQSAEGEIVSAANFNSSGQTVIAGNIAAVERAMQACKSAGAKRVLPLSVSVPSHCGLMKPAADKMAEELAAVAMKAPSVPVLQNVNASSSNDIEEIKANLIAQLFQPVQWVDTVNAMHADSVKDAIECGPGKVLAGLIKRTQNEIECSSTDTPSGLQSSLIRTKD